MDPVYKACFFDPKGILVGILLVVVIFGREPLHSLLDILMVHTSWKDLKRDHVRRDKVCLFVSFNWFFGRTGSASY